jgi:hypothetical protein
MSFFLQQLEMVLASIWVIWSLVWWIVVPLIAGIIYFEFKEHHKQVSFHHGIKWKLLRIKAPNNILKTPKAMEQVFSAAYLEGEKHWMSFEIVGRAGESRFYIRLPEQYRNLMESAIYAQYPETEITEVEDYIAQMPREMPNADFDLFGIEEGLGKEEYYPIRTYQSFEENVEERRIDTISFLVEAMAKLKDDEQIWVQIVIKPAGDAWKKEGEEAMNKLLGIETEHKKGGGLFSGFSLGFSLGEALLAPFEHPSTEVKAHDAPAPKSTAEKGPGKKEAADGIRNKIAKLGFEATVRFCYIDRRTNFSKDNISSMMAFFRQFNSVNLNYFKPDASTMTDVKKGYFKDRKTFLRKRAFYENYVSVHPHHGNNVILNTEELATIYHFPLGVVGTTELERVTSRKGGPPATLPLME